MHKANVQSFNVALFMQLTEETLSLAANAQLLREKRNPVIITVKARGPTTWAGQPNMALMQCFLNWPPTIFGTFSQKNKNKTQLISVSGVHTLRQIFSTPPTNALCTHVTALLVGLPGQLHLRRIGQRGVLGLALMMTLLVVNLQQEQSTQSRGGGGVKTRWGS